VSSNIFLMFLILFIFSTSQDFGKQFELCLQPIFEARAKRILIELCNANANTANGNELDEKFEVLLKLLEQIESKAFIKNNRMMNLSSRRILERYLKEVKKRLSFEVSTCIKQKQFDI